MKKKTQGREGNLDSHHDLTKVAPRSQQSQRPCEVTARSQCLY